MRRRWIAVGALLGMLAAGPGALRAQETPVGADLSRYDEVPLTFRYNRMLEAFVPALFDGERFFLSLVDVLAPLQVDLTLDPAARRAEGFYIDQERGYVLDFETGTATLDDRRVALAPDQYVLTELAFYVAPEVLEDLFGWEVEVSLRSLALLVEAGEELPVELAYRRQVAREGIRTATVLRPEAPLVYPRVRHLARGGVLGYTLNTTVVDEAATLQGRFAVGAEVLGGDVQGDLGLTILQRDAVFRADELRWRYVTDAYPYLTQALAGGLSSSGLRRFSYRGARLSNEPVQIRRLYGSYRIEGQSEPAWEAELYLNNQLVDYAPTDATGYYAFDIPVTYGTTLVTIRLYGPTGQYEEVERRLQIPFTFVPEGEVYYAAEGGYAEADSTWLGQGYAAAGLAPWLTAKAGVDYLDGAGTAPGRRPARVYGEASARLLRNYIATVQVAPSVSYTTALNAFYPSLATFGVSFTRFADDPLYNRALRRSEAEARFNVPLQVAGVPVYARFDGRRVVQQTGGRTSYTFRPGFTAQVLPRLRWTASYRGGFNEVPGQGLRTTTALLRTGATYAFLRRTGIPSWLGGMLLSSNLDYDARLGRLGQAEVTFSNTLFRRGRYRLALGRNFAAGFTTAELRVTFNLDQTRLTSSARVARAGASFTQNVTGAVGYDPHHRRVVFDQLAWVGRSAAALRLFVDADGDALYDPGEEVIENGLVRFRQALATRHSPRGLITAHNLQAYERYSVEIDETMIQNPFWVPRQGAFSFVTDPNNFKPVDVPFYVSGIIEGAVVRERSGRREAVPGLRLEVRGQDVAYRKTLPVFSDGSFYELGLPPGRYVAYVDSSQLDLLRAASEPAVRHFTVRVTQDGDLVEGLDFVLRDRTPEAPPPAATPANDPVPLDSSAVALDPAAPDPVVPDTSAALPPEAGITLSASPRCTGQLFVRETDVFYRIEKTDVGLWTIAGCVYQNPILWPKLWVANRSVIDDADLIYPGTTLLVPPKAPLSAEERAAHLEYWRRKEARRTAADRP